MAMLMNCINCGALIEEESRFCMECGQEILLDKWGSESPGRNAPRIRSGVNPIWYVIPFIPVINIIVIWFAPMVKQIKVALVAVGLAAAASWIVSIQIQSASDLSLSLLQRSLPDLMGFTILDLPYIAVFILLGVYYTGLIHMNRKLKKGLRVRSY